MNGLRQSMGAPLGRFTTAKSPTLLTAAEMEQLSTTGIEVELNQIRLLADGTLAYKDCRVAVHPRDLLRSSSEAPQPTKLPAFHLADCDILQDARLRHPDRSFVASTREDALFVLRLCTRGEDGCERRSERLSVCQSCLGRLCWQEFDRSLSQMEARELVAAFSLTTFFKAYPKALARQPWTDAKRAGADL